MMGIKIIFKKSVLRTVSLTAAAFMLMLAMSGCNTAENKEETAMNNAADTSSVSSAETTAAETTATAETTAETLPPVSYPCEFAKEELHCKYDDFDIFGTLYTPDNGREVHPAVILSHGYNCIGEDMKDIAEILAQNGVLAYTFDFCGGSTRSASSGESVDMSIETEQDNLRHVIDMISEMEAVDSTKLYLYGESQGGFVAALTGAEMPDRIAGMFLVYPAFSIVDQWLAMNPDDMAEPFTFMGSMTLSRTFYDGVPRYDVYEHIKAFTNHVIIYQGDKDFVVGLDYAKKVDEALPDSELIVVEGAGHGFGGKDRTLVKDGVCGYFTDNALNS